MDNIQGEDSIGSMDLEVEGHGSPSLSLGSLRVLMPRPFGARYLCKQSRTL